MNAYFRDETLTLLLGNAAEQLRTLPDGSVDCVVTSPPYFGLRDYCGHDEQIGLENNPADYVARLADAFREVRRVLAEDGTAWLNLGDSYSGGNRGTYDTEGGTTRARGHATTRPVTDLAGKNLHGIPWRTAFALQDDGWILRNAIVWHKPNAMPESVTDRLSNRHEHLFLLTKSKRYWFDLDPVREQYDGDRELSRRAHRTSTRPHTARGTWPPVGGNRGAEGKVGSSARRSTPGAAESPEPAGRNPGDVWSIPTSPFTDAHFATFPIALPRRCILAGCKPGGTVLDPFSGAGTTALAAQQLGRQAIGIDINAEYHDIALRRMSDAPLPFEGGAA